jgi:uncharacterized membrane protein YhhN
MIWLCLIACAALIYAESSGHQRLRIASKLTASTAFVTLALPALGMGPFQSWMVVGLIFGAIGDIALLGRSGRAFLGGLSAFLAGHLAYVIALAQLESPAYWIIYAGQIGLIAIAGGGIALSWLWQHLGVFKAPVVLYVAAIVAMVVGAFAVQSTGGLPAPERDYLAIGAALFFLSDLAVARDKFIVREFKNKAWGLPAYYGAQLLIASAIT